MHIKERFYQILFTRETPLSRFFDVFLIALILFATLLVMLESVASFKAAYKEVFFMLEIFITVVFTIEYALRVWSARVRKEYIFSFYGIIDIISIVPLYIMYFFPGAQVLFTLRILRFFRIFRSLKLLPFLEQEAYLFIGLKRSLPKIVVFITGVTLVSIIIGSLMYMVEGEQAGFSNIFLSIYWTVVTLTTVGYGDIVPVTVLGKTIATMLMVLGYGVIAVPTGLVTVELYNAHREHRERNVEKKLLADVKEAKAEKRKKAKKKGKKQKKSK